MMESGQHPPDGGSTIPRGLSDGDRVSTASTRDPEDDDNMRKGEGLSSFLDKIHPRSGAKSSRSQAARAGSPHTTLTQGDEGKEGGLGHDSKKGAELDDVEDLEAALETARAVISHLDEQVGTLKKSLRDSDADRESLQRMLANLGQSLKEERQERIKNTSITITTTKKTTTRGAGVESGDDDEVADEAAAAVAGTTAAEDVNGSDRDRGGGISGCGASTEIGAGAGKDGGGGGDFSSGAEEGWEDFPSLVKAGISGGWLIEPGEVMEGDVLGSGCSGVTVKGKWRGQPVAVKKVNVEGKSRASSFVREVSVLSRLRHPHVLPFYGACLQPLSRCWIITQHCTGGTLKEWLHGDKHNKSRSGGGGASLLSRRLTVAWEVARGMRYLEEATPTVMHRDLKPSNVFLTSPGPEGRALIADFGLARWLPTSTSDQVLTGETGTYLYMAPEVIRHEPHYTGLADSYSFGVMLNELISGQIPYSSDYLTPLQVAFAVADGSLRPTVASAGKFPGLAAVTVSCFSHEPGERPTFGRIVDSFDTMLPEIIAEQKGREGGGGGGGHSLWGIRGAFGDEAEEKEKDGDGGGGGGGLAAVFKGMFGSA